MNDEKENDDVGGIEVNGTAYLILHTPAGTGLPVEDQYSGEPHPRAHAFGPFFNKEEVESWLNGPDSCTKFVIELQAVRSMAIVGDLEPPPSINKMTSEEAIEKLFGAVIGGIIATSQHRSKQRQKDQRN